jgi:hypothetical protein
MIKGSENDRDGAVEGTAETDSFTESATTSATFVAELVTSLVAFAIFVCTDLNELAIAFTAFVAVFLSVLAAFVAVFLIVLAAFVAVFLIVLAAVFPITEFNTLIFGDVAELDISSTVWH